MIQYFVGAGFYVIPSYSPADYSVDNTVTSVPGIFLRNWAGLWAAISDLPTFRYIQNLSCKPSPVTTQTIASTDSGECLLREGVQQMPNDAAACLGLT